MRILLELHHPSDVHFFKHAVEVWRGRGDEVLALGRDRDVMRRLLDAYDHIPSRIATRAGQDNRFPLAEMVQRQAQVALGIAGFRPDVVASLMGSYAQSSRLFRRPNVVFTDSEHQNFNHRIAHPFATLIATPRAFFKDLGPKQARYAGYHELAYLHPKRFEPDASIPSGLGLERERYVVVRTSSFNTLHDVGGSGLGPYLQQLVEWLEGQDLQVALVAEDGAVPAALQSRVLRMAPEDFHHVLAGARFVVSEGASTSSEAACLGVPCVFVNSLRLGYLEDQERRYGLVRNLREGSGVRSALERWLNAPDPDWMRDARAKLVADHEDVTDVIVRLVDLACERPAQR